VIQKLVAFALRMPFIIVSTVIVIIVAGLAAYSRLDIEAYPNPVPPLVEVLTQPPGWSAEEVERYVTIPL
jgi:heavy metal efflux system protein